MRVLSLCDGMSIAAFALRRAGIPIDAYFRVEQEFAKNDLGEYVPTNMQWPARIGDAALASICAGERLTGAGPHQTMSVQEFGAKEARRIGKIDLLIAGFPCQPFSAAGARLGMHDPRAGVLDEIMRIIRLVKPAAFVLENVVAPRKIIAQIQSKVSRWPTFWDSACFGAQSRRRAFYTSEPARAPLVGFSPDVVGDIMVPPNDERLRGVRFYHWQPLPAPLGRKVLVVGRKGSFAGVFEDILAGNVRPDEADYTVGARADHSKSSKPSQNYQVLSSNGKTRAMQESGNASSNSGVYTPPPDGYGGAGVQPSEIVQDGGGKMSALRGPNNTHGLVGWIERRRAELAYSPNGKAIAIPGHRRVGSVEAGLYAGMPGGGIANNVNGLHGKSPALTAKKDARTGGQGTYPAIPQSRRVCGRDGKIAALTAPGTARQRTDNVVEAGVFEKGRHHRVYAGGKICSLSTRLGSTDIVTDLSECAALFSPYCRPLIVDEMLALMNLPLDFDFGGAPVSARRSAIGNGFDCEVVARVLLEML